MSDRELKTETGRERYRRDIAEPVLRLSKTDKVWQRLKETDKRRRV